MIIIRMTIWMIFFFFNQRSTIKNFFPKFSILPFVKNSHSYQPPEPLFISFFTIIDFFLRFLEISLECKYVITVINKIQNIENKMDFDFNYIQSEDFNIDMIEQNLSEKDKGI
jgi:hypothetical protein